MLEDKYIGLALAISSSAAIGTSSVVTKKGLNAASQRGENASDGYGYLRNPVWWAGMSLLILGEFANFAAYIFAPPILVTPLGALSVLVGAVLASFLLKEELGHIGRVGCTLCLAGSCIIVLHAPEDKPIETIDDMLRFALQPGFLLYCLTVLVFSLVMIYSIAPKYGKKNPLVYVSICSLVGSISVMAVKAFGVAVNLTLAGNNQFTYPSTYAFGFVVAGCIVVQLHYLNKALDVFATNVVNPMYYVCFSTATIVASLILFQGFNTTEASNTVSLLIGFIVTFIGVHLLNISRKPEPAPGTNGHLPHENGFATPQASARRFSLDSSGGWPYHSSAEGFSSGHGRRGSIYRNQGTALQVAFEDEEEGVGLVRIRESHDDDDDDDADERTRLTTSRGHQANGPRLESR